MHYTVTHITPKGFISAIAEDGRTINGIVSRETIAVGDFVCFLYKARSGCVILRKCNTKEGGK